MTDPVRRRMTPLRDRPMIYVIIILCMLSLLATTLLWMKGNTETRNRIHQLQDVICGVYVPIAKAHTPATQMGLGQTIVVATRHGALELHCPGVK